MDNNTGGHFLWSLDSVFGKIFTNDAPIQYMCSGVLPISLHSHFFLKKVWKMFGNSKNYV